MYAPMVIFGGEATCALRETNQKIENGSGTGAKVRSIVRNRRKEIVDNLAECVVGGAAQSMRRFSWMSRTSRE